MALRARIAKEIKNKKETQITTVFSRSQNKLISHNKLSDLLQEMRDRGEEAHRTFVIGCIRVLNGDSWRSFHNHEDMEDYYEGRVRDNSKFLEFHQVEVTVFYS
jgi:retron-type reverse transcriptase